MQLNDSLKAQPNNPEALTLLREALLLKANAGGAIKRKVEQALALLEAESNQP